MSDKKITWKEPTGDEVDCTVQVCTKHPRENFSRAREATLDDLRKACEAVGLVVIERDIHDVVAKERASCMARTAEAEARVAELETALNNAANGIGFGDAGPVVYALNARHDERAAEWESEREELVRTRQETQDKLSEARKELGELGAKLRTSERYVDVHVADLAAMRARFSDTFARAEKAERDADACAADLAALRASLCDERDAAIARAEKAEAERDAFGAKNVEFHRAYGEEQARATIASLESRLAALTAPVDGEPTAAVLRQKWASNTELANSETIAEFALTQWRSGHAAGLITAARDAEAAAKDAAVREMHGARGEVDAEAARYALQRLKPLADSLPNSEADEQLIDEAMRKATEGREMRKLAPRDLPRATDEELVALHEDTYQQSHEACGVHKQAKLSAVRAVADRVRREQCLVTRAVESGRDLRIEKDASGIVWVIETADQAGHSREIEVDAPSDVARVLGEMLGGGQ